MAPSLSRAAEVRDGSTRADSLPVDASYGSGRDVPGHFAGRHSRVRSAAGGAHGIHAAHGKDAGRSFDAFIRGLSMMTFSFRRRLAPVLLAIAAASLVIPA